MFSPNSFNAGLLPGIVNRPEPTRTIARTRPGSCRLETKLKRTLLPKRISFALKAGSSF